MMRLRLSIHRNGLPVSNILWTVGQAAPYVAATTNSTISQLLENVNDIIPLESEEWGLEDYVVEVRGFECLHFSELSSVLKDEDEVTIRPLQSTDLRFRKLSGRHQIAHDGKHLIDGVAFGRPFLRTTARPAISIPPRKRRKLLHETEDGDVEYNGEALQPQLLLRASSDDADEDGDSDKENDADYVPGMDENEVQDSDSDSDISDGEEDFLEDAVSSFRNPQDRIEEIRERSLGLDGAGERERGTPRRSERRTRFLLEQERPSEAPTERQSCTPGEYENALLDYFTNPGAPVSERRNVRPQSKVAAELSAPLIQNTSGAPEILTGQSDAGISISPMNVKMETDPADSSEDESDDSDFQSNDSESESSSGDSAEESLNKAPETSAKKPIGISSSKSTEESLEESSEDSSSEEEDSSSDSSDSSESDDGSSESESGSLSSNSSSVSNSDSSSSGASESFSGASSSASSDEDSSGSEPEIMSSRGPEKKSTAPHSVSHSLASQPFLRAPEGQAAKLSNAVPVPRGCGRLETKRRNQRRRDHKRIESLKAQGLLPQNAGRRELAEYMSDGSSKAINSASKDRASEQTSRETSEFEAKRQQLLLALASGGVEVAPVERRHRHSKETTKPQEQYISEDAAAKGSRSVAVEEPAGSDGSSQASQPRSKLDVPSSRRMLFGSLGLRTPKTKEDEEKIKQELMKSAKLPEVSKVIYDEPDDNDMEMAEGHAQKDDESWKGKITLMAVECCEDGIELSAPPFPFMQRWDPQQQLNKKRNNQSKNKRRKRNYNQYYEDEAQEYSYDDHGYYQDQEYYYGGEEEYPAEPELNYDDEPYEEYMAEEEAIEEDSRVDTEANDQIMRDAEEVAAENALGTEDVEEDLPDLPANMNSLKQLTLEHAVPGAVIAFRQLTVSQATNWEPKITDFRTARVDTSTDGMLELTLSKRDLPRKKKSYDHETGKRIFGKFEMPHSDEEDESEGYLELAFDELMEPRLVQGADAIPAVENEKSSNEQNHGPFAEITTKRIESNHQRFQPEHSVGPFDEQARSETFQVNRDAGLRTSVGPEVESMTHGKEFRESTVNSITNLVQNEDLGSISPRFNGIGSSPPLDEPNDETPRAQATSHALERLLSSNDPASIIDLYGDSSPTKDISSVADSSALDKQQRSFTQGTSFETAPDGPSNNGDTSTTSHTLVGEQDRPESDNEFPELETILSSAKSSFDSIKQEGAKLKPSSVRGSPSIGLVSGSRPASGSGSPAASGTALRTKIETTMKPAKKRGRPRKSQTPAVSALASPAQLPDESITSTQTSSRKESLAPSEEQDPDIAVAIGMDLGLDTEDQAPTADDDHDTRKAFTPPGDNNQAIGNASTEPPSASAPPPPYTIDLTLSSDPPAPPHDDDSSDDNYNYELGLPAGEGWVRKRKARSTQPYGPGLGLSSSQPVGTSARSDGTSAGRQTRRTTRQSVSAAAAAGGKKRRAI